MKPTLLVRRASYLAFVVAAASCGGTELGPEYPPVEEPPALDTPPEPETPAEPTPPPPPPAPPPITLSAGEHTPIEGAMPTIALVAPRNNAVIRGTGPIPLRIRLANWALPAGGGGNHVHLIVDNHPYIRLDDVSQPLDLRALARQHLGGDLTEGSHLVRIFPSRMSHESVKANGAFAMAVIHVGRRTPAAEWTFDPRAPLLTYSRPKGCYGGNDAQRILLDYYVTNTTLAADGHRVRLSIDGQPIGEPMTSWVPYYVTNLPAGDHTFLLELLDAQGQPVAGPFNRTERRITTRADACPAPAAPAPAPPAAGHGEH
ncbi:MAG: hypothetical protein IT379_01415 [Deltaproteobacteria bacterium]|nr:hypothetical protein [Deltaproteobacteria bacterium]